MASFADNANPFYTFNQFQSDPGFDWTLTEPIGGAGGYIEKNPQVAWTRYLSSLGIGPGNTTPLQQFAQSQFQNAQRGFEAALAEDPTMIFQRYLSNVRPDILRMFQNLSPRQRGEQPQGPLRWIGDV